MKKPLILTAMEMEARAIEKRLAGTGLQYDLKVIGIRACRMPADLTGAGVIIMAGLAGALDPELTIGSCVYGTGIYTSDQLIGTPEEKARLFKETGAAAVDMETAIVLKAARAARVQFYPVRAISDTARDSIDPELFKLVDEVGHVRPLAAAGLFMGKPSLIAQARKLQTNSNKALESLADAVHRLLVQWERGLREHPPH
jgi:hypothetical protein